MSEQTKAPASFTRGPWERTGLTVTAFGRGIVATCPTPNAGGVFECSANAHLIASAPAMYEALVAAERAIDDCQNYRSHLHHNELAQVRAALALARGER